MQPVVAGIGDGKIVLQKRISTGALMHNFTAGTVIKVGRAFPSRPPCPKKGFTIVELLVVMGVIGVLVAIILPAVLSARAAARRAQCKNNLRSLGTAVLHQAESQRRFPVAGFWGLPGSDGPYHNWVVQVLPWLEQKPISDAWNTNAFLTDPVNSQLADRHISMLACPDDVTVTGQGDLSYVANEGIGWTGLSCYVETKFGGIDLNANGHPCGGNMLVPEPATPSNRDYMYKMGLFFVDNWPQPLNGPIRHHTLNSVQDGLTNTMMLTENVNAGADLQDSSGLSNWASPQPWRSMFFLSPLVCQDLSCKVGAVNYEHANDRNQAKYRVASINFLPSAGATLEGTSPWPSAYHSGGVHALFADGRVQFLSEQINGQVYAALLSPQGTTIQGPLAQQVVTDAEY